MNKQYHFVVRLYVVVMVTGELPGGGPVNYTDSGLQSADAAGHLHAVVTV